MPATGNDADNGIRDGEPDRLMEPPTVPDLSHGISRYLGPDAEGQWAAMCAEADVAADAGWAGGAAMDRLLAVISEHSPLCQVSALSWGVRVRAARGLAEPKNLREPRPAAAVTFGSGRYFNSESRMAAILANRCAPTF